jgi:two-component system, OmpR family, alkaline phosphatase synthesis response regulator PhoP
MVKVKSDQYRWNYKMSKKILIVEDEENIRDLLLAIFSDQPDYAIRSVEDGQEALQAIRSDCPDIILLDVNLPKLSGYRLCKIVKSDPTSKAVKILMLSGMTQKQDRLKAREEGADGYITKPFDSKELIDAVDALKAVI